MQQLHRHRVQHLVAQHHGLQRVGQGVEPLHPAAKRRQTFGLALTQRAREVHDAVAAHTLAQRAQQLRGQRARAGAKLQHLVQSTRVQSLRHLACQRLAKQWGHFGRGDKVAADAGMRPNSGAPLA